MTPDSNKSAFDHVVKRMSPGLPIREFISVFWRTWVVILAPFLFSPMVIFNADDPKVLQKQPMFS